MPVKNICYCPSPPGGQTVCEPHQAAFCRVLNGIVETGCADPPDVGALAPAQARTTLNNWALALITRQARRFDVHVSAGELRILQSGVYQDSQTLELVHFRLPWNVTTGAATPAAAGGGGVVDVNSSGEFEASALADADADVGAARDVAVSLDISHED